MQLVKYSAKIGWAVRPDPDYLYPDPVMPIIVKTTETTSRPTIITLKPLSRLPLVEDFSSSGSLFKYQLTPIFRNTSTITVQLDENIAPNVL